jgi:hypothetical protein
LNFRWRCWRDENEFFEEFEERRPERSRGGFVGAVDNMGRSVTSSAQLKHVETGGSGGFWAKMGIISVFWSFLVKLGIAGLISNDGVVWDGAGELQEVKDDVLAVEMAGLGGFWLNMGDFSVFW